MNAEFRLELFERVSAGRQIALLRIAGTWHSKSRERLSPPLLVIDNGRRSTRHAALPGPDNASPLASSDGTPWRAAYSAPSDESIPARSTAFALDVGGAIIDLPAPVSHELAPVPVREPGDEDAAAELAAVRAAMIELERQLQDERAARRTEAPAEGGEELQALGARLAQAQARAAEAEERAPDAQARAAAAEAWATEAEAWLQEAGAREADHAAAPHAPAGRSPVDVLLLVGSVGAFTYLAYELIRIVVG